MTVQINYKTNNVKKNSENLVLFVNDKINLSSLKKLISANEYKYISDLIDTNDKKKEILTYNIHSKRKIILIVSKKKTKCFRD